MTETVDHDLYGIGVIESERYQGFELLVHFTSGIKKWVRRSELKTPLYKKTNSGQDDAPRRGSISILTDTIQPEKSDRTIPFQSETFSKDTTTPISSAQRSNSSMAEVQGNEIDSIISFRPTRNIKVAEIDAPSIHSHANVPNLPNTVLKGVTHYPSQKYAHRQTPSSKEDVTSGSRVIIEALRLGGVPHEKVEHFTAGRDEELKQIQEWFESKDGCLLIDGDYGVGKSHILELTASHALNDRWAVARVEIDPHETPFHKPKRLYQRIIESLEYYSDGQIHDFNDLMTFMAESPDSSNIQTLETHPYFGTFIRNWSSDSSNENLWDWIKGDNGTSREFFPRLLDYQLAANIYCNLISGLSWIAKNILGLKGLLILIDEAESIDKSFYTGYQYRMALNTVKGLIYLANDDKSLIGELDPEKGIDFRIGKGYTYIGHHSGLLYPRTKHHQFPYLWKESTNLKIVLAFVPEFFKSLECDLDTYIAIKKIPSLKIESLSLLDHAFLLKRITDIYQEAYSFKPQRNVFELLPTEKTRIFVKAAVEALDLMRFHPDRDVQDFMIHDYDK